MAGLLQMVEAARRNARLREFGSQYLDDTTTSPQHSRALTCI